VRYEPFLEKYDLNFLRREERSYLLKCK